MLLHCIKLNGKENGIINGRWYHVDVTADDPLSGNEKGYDTHDFYNLSDDEIGKDHTWDTSKYPSAN